MNSQNTHDLMIKNIAAKYKKDGYEVSVEPQTDELPFSLGRYRPDIIARRNDEGYIIEVKTFSRGITIERYRDISEIVSQHAGWRFLLVTGEDSEIENLLSWEQIFNKKEKADRLVASKENEAAFLSFWTILEALMRKQAERVSVPIERFPTSSLINHLYSQGELSISQFDNATMLLNIRNRLVHGFQTVAIDESVNRLQQLVNELIKLWKPEAAQIGNFK